MYTYYNDKANQADQFVEDDQTDQSDQDDQTDQTDQTNQVDQFDQDDQLDQADQADQTDQGSIDSGILVLQEFIDIQYRPKAQKLKSKYRISEHRRSSPYDNKRSHRKSRKSPITSKTNQEDIVIINPSNYVKKNKIDQSYSVIYHQNHIKPLSPPSNYPKKKTEISNGKDSAKERSPVMIKNYKIHPNGQFEYRQTGDKYKRPIKGKIEISINNERFNISRPEVIRKICGALDGIFKRNLSEDEFKTIELNSDSILSFRR